MSLIVFDWETTSAEPKTARGVQFAAIHASNGSVEDMFNQICDPEVDIHHEASLIHGITPEMTQGQPKDYEVAAAFLSGLDHQRGVVITAGHNSLTFDIPITRRLAKMGGYEGAMNQPHIDTLVLSQRVWPHAPSFRLSATSEEAKKEGAIGLTQWLELGDGQGAHDARADIYMVLKLIDRLSTETGKKVEALAAWMGEPFVHQTCHFGKHRGKPWGKAKNCVPFFYVKWCCENWSDASLDMQATILYHYGLSFKFKGALR
jgi:DNA polymerase III epsilon subunit-like protein